MTDQELSKAVSTVAACYKPGFLPFEQKVLFDASTRLLELSSHPSEAEGAREALEKVVSTLDQPGNESQCQDYYEEALGIARAALASRPQRRRKTNDD